MDLLAELLLAFATLMAPTPACQEDATIMGSGDFSGITHRWTAYQCGPAVDDYQSEIGEAIIGWPDGTVEVLH